MIGAVRKKCLHRGDSVAIRGVDEIGCPELASKLFFLRLGIDRDDAVGTGKLCASDDVEADPADPDHHRGLSRFSDRPC